MWEESEENEVCPLCAEELEPDDLNFKPCRCGYQICAFCYHKLNEKGVGQCPNCRRDYDQSNLNFTPHQEKESKKVAPTQDKKVKKKTMKIPPRKQLANVRVIQRNLVYVVGLTLNVAKEDFLRRSDNFSKFGKIAKIVINKSNLTSSQKLENATRTPTVSAYITYTKPEDAQRAIQAVDGTWLDGKLLRASFGTTKYCSYFLKGIECTNPDCMYLHDYGQEEDTFNKEDIILRNGLPIPSNSERYEEYYPSKTTVEKQIWNFASSNQRQDQEEELDEEEEYDEEYDEEEQVEISPRREKTIVSKSPPKPVVMKKEAVLPSTAQWGTGVPIQKPVEKPVQKQIPVVTSVSQGAWGKPLQPIQNPVPTPNPTPIQQNKSDKKEDVFDSQDQVFSGNQNKVQYSFNMLQIGKSQWNGNEFSEKRNKSRFQFAQDERKSEYFDPFGSSDNFGFFTSQNLQDSFRALLPNVNIQFNTQAWDTNMNIYKKQEKDEIGDSAILDYQ